MSWYSDHRNALSASSSKNSTLHIREKMSERKCTVFSKIFSVVYDGMTIRTFNFPRENHRETNSFQLNITILNVNYFKSNFISQQIFSLVCRTALAQILINDHLFHYIFFYQKMNDRKILGLISDKIRPWKSNMQFVFFFTSCLHLVANFIADRRNWFEMEWFKNISINKQWSIMSFAGFYLL